jgi:hypothetical protein
MIALKWLRNNAYHNVANLIDEVNAENKAAGRKTRRNWWDTLAGGDDGRPFTVNGREFPVLRAAQIRQGKPTTPNAIYLNPNEQPPDVVATKRWPRRHLPSKARRLSDKPRRQHARRKAS